MSRTWFITGASRGLGAAIAHGALAAGDNVVASGRRRAQLEDSFAAHTERLLIVELDVTQEQQAVSAVAEAVERFGGIDVLVNNAGYGQLGPFEDNHSSDAERQFATNVFGVFNVCRAVLPVMRKQRSGHIFNISSVGGVVANGGACLYSASKFAVEGFSEALAQEVASFGIHITLVEPGVFRTDFLDDSSAAFGERGVEDYAAFSAKIKASCAANNHTQKGDPAKLAAALIQLVDSGNPPLRYVAGSDAYRQIIAKLDQMREEVERGRELSFSTDGLS